jgi:hypothetical protein
MPGGNTEIATFRSVEAGFVTLKEPPSFVILSAAKDLDAVHFVVMYRLLLYLRR